VSGDVTEYHRPHERDTADRESRRRPRRHYQPDDHGHDHDERQHRDERDPVVHVAKVDPVDDQGRGDADEDADQSGQSGRPGGYLTERPRGRREQHDRREPQRHGDHPYRPVPGVLLVRSSASTDRLRPVAGSVHRIDTSRGPAKSLVPQTGRECRTLLVTDFGGVLP